MRVLIVSCVFPPEPVVSAQTSVQIAESMFRRGHQVTVVTAFPNRPGGQLYPGYKRQLFQHETTEAGYVLTRCLSVLSPESRLTSRFFENLSFGLTSAWVALVSPRPDVIYANTWPIVATGLLFLIARLRRIPLVISVQDIYPESLVLQKRISATNWLARLMRWIDGYIARGCQAVIVISRRFAEIYHLTRAVPRDRLFVVPNWGNSNPVELSATHDLRFERNIPRDAFLLVYGGNIGASAGVEILIEAVRSLKDCPHIYLLIAGQGSHLSACQALAAGHAQISFYAPWPSAQTMTVYQSADALVLPTQGSQSLVSVPSKLIAYMLAARPVIGMALPDSDMAEIIRQAGCGWLVAPDSPQSLATMIREVAQLDRGELRQRGEQGRAYALQHLTREACLPKVVEVLETVGLRRTL